MCASVFVVGIKRKEKSPQAVLVSRGGRREGVGSGGGVGSGEERGRGVGEGGRNGEGDEEGDLRGWGGRARVEGRGSGEEKDKYIYIDQVSPCLLCDL